MDYKSLVMYSGIVVIFILDIEKYMWSDFCMFFHGLNCPKKPLKTKNLDKLPTLGWICTNLKIYRIVQMWFATPLTLASNPLLNIWKEVNDCNV